MTRARAELLTWVVVVLGLLGAYVGYYYKQACPYRIWNGTVSLRFLNGTDAFGNAKYEIHPGRERFFAPIHYVDRSIRPQVWKHHTTIW